MKQRSLSMTGYFDKGKKTRRELFLAEMERVVPWSRLLALIEPHYPKGSRPGVARRCRWSGCFASTAFSSGTPIGPRGRGSALRLDHDAPVRGGASR